MRILLCIFLLCGGFCVAEDFEKGLPTGWQCTPENKADWKVIPEPNNPSNHVLAAMLKGKGSFIVFGDKNLRNCRLTGRFKFTNFTGPYFHVKFAARANEPKSSCYLNVRSNGPIIVRHVDEEFTPICRMGEVQPEPDKWYAVEFSCKGAILEGTVRDDETGKIIARGRCYEDMLDRGGCALMIHLPEDAAGTFLFDDIEVTLLPEEEAPKMEIHELKNDSVRVAFNATLGLLEITDLRTGRTWKSTPSGAEVPFVKKVSRCLFGKKLKIKMDTVAGPVKASIELHDSEVLIKVKPDGRGRYTPLVFPPPLLPSAESELVLPTDEGVIVPATRTDMKRLTGTYNYSQGGLLMPWFGILEGEAGIMEMLETPADWSMRVEPVNLDGNTVLVPRFVWLPSKTDLRYKRKMRICLFAEGGYVAMAKRYRKYLIDSHRFRTLEDKAKEIPNVRKLIGAINILDRSRDDTVLDWMIRSGIKRAVYSCGEFPSRIDKAKRAGYVVNRYDIYTDVAGPELLKYWGKPRNELDKGRIGYPEECYIMRNGKPLPGFAYPIGAKGGVDPKGKEGLRVRCYKRCTKCQLHWMKKIIPKQIEFFGYTARFIDVETAHPPYECYSEKHPLTRGEDIEERIKLFDYLRSLGQICSSEGGADWASHALHYQEGSLTLTRFGWIPGVYVGTKPFTLPEEYIKAQLDASIRAPLHELVYHDVQFMTWRWNHTPNRWDKRQYWDDWDLIHIINAQMPIFVVEAKYLQEQGWRILKSYRDICGVLEKVGGVEMTDHRFLSEDRLLQESRFANGWHVVVNFSESYRRYGEKVMPPKSFLIERFEEQSE